MKRDMSVCRFRKAAGLSCHNCMYFMTCPDPKSFVKKDDRRKKSDRLQEGTWTSEQVKIMEDLRLTSVQAAEKAGVTPHQVRHYRERNDLAKYRRREKRKT